MNQSPSIEAVADESENEARRLIEHARGLRRGQGLVDSSLSALAEYMPGGEIDPDDPEFNWMIDRLASEGGLDHARLVLRALREHGVTEPLNRRVLGFLDEHPEGATLRTIADALGVDRQPVSSTLSMLQRMGKVARDEAGVWRATHGGEIEGPLSVSGSIGMEVYAALKTLGQCEDGFLAGTLGAMLGRPGTSLASTLSSLRAQGIVERLPSGMWRVHVARLDALVPGVEPMPIPDDGDDGGAAP